MTEWRKESYSSLPKKVNMFYTCNGAEDRECMGNKEMRSSWKSVHNTLFINMPPDIFDNLKIFVHGSALLPSNCSQLPRVKGFPTHFPTKLTVVVHQEYSCLDECFGTIRKDNRSESSSILNLPAVKKKKKILLERILFTCVPAAAWGIGMICEVWVWETVCAGVVLAETEGCCSWYCPGCWEEGGCCALCSRKKRQKLYFPPNRDFLKHIPLKFCFLLSPKWFQWFFRTCQVS